MRAKRKSSSSKQPARKQVQFKLNFLGLNGGRAHYRSSVPPAQHQQQQPQQQQHEPREQHNNSPVRDDYGAGAGDNPFQPPFSSATTSQLAALSIRARPRQQQQPRSYAATRAASESNWKALQDPEQWVATLPCRRDMVDCEHAVFTDFIHQQ